MTLRLTSHRELSDAIHLLFISTFLFSNDFVINRYCETDLSVEAILSYRAETFTISKIASKLRFSIRLVYMFKIYTYVYIENKVYHKQKEV